jgi:hypothetical protein
MQKVLPQTAKENLPITLYPQVIENDVEWSLSLYMLFDFLLLQL